jgi:KDO2-lipid IV(A) lauroyltransferase
MHSTNPDYKPLETRKSPRWRRLRRAVQYVLARALLAWVGRLSIPAAQRVGRAIGRIGYALARTDRAVCDYQLRIAFPLLDDRARGRMIARCFQQLGMTALEALAMPRLRRESERWLALEAVATLREAHARGRGVILVTAHCANWELLSPAFDRLRIPALAVVRSLANPRLNALMTRQRQSDFMRVVERGGPDAGRQILRCLKNGNVLVVAIDQDIDAQSVYVNFFGRPARTPRVAASLALRMGAAIVTAFGERRPDGSHCFDFREIPVTAALRDSAHPELELTQVISDAIESHIRRFPEQWAWNHRRWLHRPETPSAPASPPR